MQHYGDRDRAAGCAGSIREDVLSLVEVVAYPTQ